MHEAASGMSTQALLGNAAYFARTAARQLAAARDLSDLLPHRWVPFSSQ